MSPVPGKPGIGMAFSLNVMVGAADAVAAEPRTARLSTAIQADVLRKTEMDTMSLPFWSIERRRVDKRATVAKRIHLLISGSCLLDTPQAPDGPPLPPVSTRYPPRTARPDRKS